MRDGGGPGRGPLLIVAMTVGIALAGCGGGSGPDRADTIAATAPSSAPAVAPAPPRTPPAALDIAAGRVAVEQGPFTDRVELAGLALTPGDAPAVRGRILNTVDVSELIVLELQADFYDARGRYVGTGRQVFEDAHAGAGGAPLRFAIRAASLRRPAASALLSIPQLVNE